MDFTLSVEEIFGMYDTNHDGKIDKQEKQNAKNINLFPKFKVKKGMTLDKFERKNLETYEQYDLNNTWAYEMQQAKNSLNAFEIREMERLEQELKEKQVEMEIRLNGFNYALNNDIVLTQEQLNLPINEFIQLMNSIIINNKK